MDDRKLYQQKKQAQLDQWQAELDKLRAKAKAASAESQLQLNRQIEAMQGRIDEGKSKLSELSDASGEAWESIKKGIDAASASLELAMKDAASKFKKSA